MPIEVVDPATGRTIRTVPETPAGEVDAIVERADRAFEAWRGTPFDERAARMRRAAGVLRERAGAYARLMAEEMGKPVKEGRAEAEKCAWVCEHYADNAERFLADEPVASLDPVSARKVMELLVELNKRDGLGVIVTLHQVDYAIRYCERVVALKAGKVVYDGPATGLDTRTLVDIYGPEFEDAFWETKQ